MKPRALLVFLFLFLIFFSTTIVFASASSTSGYAWSENTGYMDFSQVTVENTVLSGYAYSPNVGWISFNCSNTDSCGTTDYKVSNDNGTLSGYAWSENSGYIDFSQATIDTSSGVFSGYAYSPNIGWISMNCDNTSSCGTADYKVTTTWRKTVHHSGGSSPALMAQFQAQQQALATQTPPPTPPPLSLSDIQKVLKQVKPELTDEENKTQAELFLKFLTDQQNLKTSPPLFTRTLKLGMTGEDVKVLQIYLNTHSYIISPAGAGSPSNETTKFGSLTAQAVKKFQTANNLTPDGVVGPITRALFQP